MTTSASVHRPVNQAKIGALSRLFDVVVAVSALVVLLPVIALVGLAILIESGRPILFRQRRLGRDGAPFMILKFKKFHNACDGVGPHLTSTGDSRLTRIGAILQRTKLDEVPQFLNVLAGDMAIVGPRPESMRFSDGFTGNFRAILDQKPGIFGPNQVLFRHEDQLLAGHKDVEDYYRRILFPVKASVDLIYFSSRTFSSDIGLLFSAFVAIVFGKARAEHFILSQNVIRSSSAGPSNLPLSSAVDLSSNA